MDSKEHNEWRIGVLTTDDNTRVILNNVMIIIVIIIALVYTKNLLS